jgi:thioredoxin 1
MPIDTIIHTNAQSIDRVLRTGLPVLLVFWQRSAPQSAELDPVLTQLAATYAGRALIAKVDAAAEPDLVRRYDVRLLPSLIAVKQGSVEATLPGRVPDAAVQSWLAYLVQGGARPVVASGPGIPTATGQPLPANGKGHHAAAQPATARPTTARPTTAHPTTAQPSAPPTEPVVLTDATFDRAIRSDQPVLVDFWAPWCGPCRMVAPSVSQLAQEYAGRAVVAKLNVDENPQAAHRYGIRSIPSLLIFRRGQVIDTIVGAQPLNVLRQRLALAVGS